MTYQYKCNKCRNTTDYICLEKDKPETLICMCGGILTYDWSQYSVATILIPERHRA